MNPAAGSALARSLWLILLIPTVAFAQLRAEPYVTGLNLPIEFVQDPSNPSVQYVVEQAGVIRVIHNGALRAAPFLDLRALVIAGGEWGLLGLAFPPDYGASGRCYVFYTRIGTAGGDVGDLVVSRYRRSASDPFTADPDTRKDLVWGSLAYIDHSANSNHNGGHMAFGPDGMLYIAVGDGGGANDSANNAQNPATLLGKILRVDVNVLDEHLRGYVIPSDNPFANGGGIGALPEIWAFGVRNPWKFSFDDVGGGSNALIIADVGQSSLEEINYEPAGRGGRNYGWRNREGTRDNQPFVNQPVPSAYLPLTDPIYEYDHSVGRSITGGFVYRGVRSSAFFKGRYFFADFVTGRVWSLAIAVDPATGGGRASNVLEHTAELGGQSVLGAISAFGRDASGELYIVSYGGTVFRIVDLTAPPDVAVTVFNYDGFGSKDVLLYNNTTGEWTIHIRTPDGGFARGPSGGWAPGWQIFVANFNGDSYDDLFLYSVSTGVFVKVITTASGFVYFSQVWRPGFTVFIVDFNGDGRSDILLYDAATGLWVTCISTGNGTAGFDYGSGGWLPGWRVFPANFDDDSRTDLLLYDPAGGTYCTALTRGSSTFWYYCGGWAPGWLPFIGNFDFDGRSDVFLYNPVSGTFVVARSTGFGTGPYEYWSGGWAPGWSVQVADFNRDGRDDLFLYDANGVWVKVINMGPSFLYSSGGWARWRTAIADLDVDGNDDVFLYDPATRVWVQALSTSPHGFGYISGVFVP